MAENKPKQEHHQEYAMRYPGGSHENRPDLNLKEYTIDFAGAETVAELHALIAKELGFPEWYGANLDALYECLTEMPLCMVILRHTEALGRIRNERAKTPEEAGVAEEDEDDAEEGEGPAYALAVMEVFEEACKRNPDLLLSFSEEYS